MEENENEQVVNNTEPTDAGDSSTDRPTNTESQPESIKEAGSESSKHVPYERFQEMVHARQESDAKIKAYEERVSKMEREFQSRFESLQPKTVKEQHPLVKAMKDIDPKYAEYFEQQEARLKDYDSLKQEFQSSKQEQIRKQYESAIDSLHVANKTPDAVKAYIRSDLDAKALRGEIQTLDQVSKFYKSSLDGLNKLLEAHAREKTQSYVQDKRKDSATPSSQPKGVAASGKDKGFKGTREDLLANIAKNAVARARSERDA